ncbi:antitoxin VapB family protein [Candidatus Woesearchaeota archaeon]|nr:antitoxin VapB family protein [Candidatus Woesearchaeota archaeon]
MTTKCITITSEAYERLSMLKAPYESFSEVITKLTKKYSFFDLIGLLSNKEAEEMREHVADLRKRLRKEVNQTAERLK